MRVLLFVLLIVAVETYTMRPAFANGRFPLAQQALVTPGSNGTGIVIRSTFGLLVSRDRGSSFDWVCEETFGYSGAWDPPVAFADDGTLYVGLEHGLATTRDFCEVARVPELEGETVKDLSVDTRGTVLVLTTTPNKPSALYRKLKGRPFERIGKGLEKSYLVTVDAAPSRPSRIYVTGQPLGTLEGRYYRSDDGGLTFVELDQTRSHPGVFFLVGVDPKDPARVVSRFLHFEGSEMTISEDAAKTSKVVLDLKSAMYGAAMAPDGTVYAGSGLASDGVFVSHDRGRTYARSANVAVQCLTATADTLFQCENPMSLGGPAFGLSEDRGKTFRTVASFGSIRGPLACGGATPARCQKPWSELDATLSPWRDGGAPPTDAGLADDAGADGGAADAGVPSDTKKRGCGGCGATESEPGSIHGGALALAVWAVSFVRRSRSRSLHGRGRSTTRSIGHHPHPCDFSRPNR